MKNKTTGTWTISWRLQDRNTANTVRGVYEPDDLLTLEDAVRGPQEQQEVDAFLDALTEKSRGLVADHLRRRRNPFDGAQAQDPARVAALLDNVRSRLRPVLVRRLGETWCGIKLTPKVLQAAVKRMIAQRGTLSPVRCSWIWSGEKCTANSTRMIPSWWKVAAVVVRWRSTLSVLERRHQRRQRPRAAAHGQVLREGPPHRHRLDSREQPASKLAHPIGQSDAQIIMLNVITPEGLWWGILRTDTVLIQGSTQQQLANKLTTKVCPVLLLIDGRHGWRSYGPAKWGGSRLLVRGHLQSELCIQCSCSPHG